MTRTFKSPPHERPPSESPERLFDDLPRTRDGVASLWSHQADMLRTYHADHLTAADVALELPTGAGKTLPALLIAEWRRLTLGDRVAYACPTVQLANQVHAEAVRQGIDAVTLVGPHRSWEVTDASRYTGARAIAITTYSSIFNSNPALTAPQALLFDDAHAAEHYVSSAWSLSLRRSIEPTLYQRTLEAIADELTEMHLQRLLAIDPDPITRREVSMLPVAALRRRAVPLDLALSTAEGTLKFSYSMIRSRLDRCILYFGWNGFLIRPYIPPTSHHPIFTDADQRIYLSATLGYGGELERAFGRAPISRLPVPEGWDQRSSGRRFFIFPELIRATEANRLSQDVINMAGKALVVAPSEPQLDVAKEKKLPPGIPVFGKGDIEHSLDAFRSIDRGVLALANRYDGLDLADDSCRVTVLDGLPTGGHLQEDFLITSLRAGRVLEERLRTRIIQGAGRCTRGLKDHSVVVILGEDLTKFLQRKEVRSALRPDSQAELQFGIDNSEGTGAELLAAVKSCLLQDHHWQNEAEPAITAYRRGATRALPLGTEYLAESARLEVKAWSQIWQGEYLSASQSALEVAQQLMGDALAPYRALWLYYASAWQNAAAEETGDTAVAGSSKELLRKAHSAAAGTWLRELAPLPVGDRVLDPIDEVAADRVAKSSLRNLSSTKWAKLISALLAGLSQPNASGFEQGLVTLGQLLGADSFKPEAQGRADAVWIFDELWWVTLEAKSEALSTGLISMSDVRQTNTQLKSLAADRDRGVPKGSISLLVTPKQLAHQDAVAVAEPHLHFCSPAEILSLAQETVAAWRGVRTFAMNLAYEEAGVVVRRHFADRRILPSHVKARIANNPIAG